MKNVEGISKGTEGRNEQRDTRREELGWGGLGGTAGTRDGAHEHEKQVQSPRVEDCRINSVLLHLDLERVDLWKKWREDTQIICLLNDVVFLLEPITI